MQRSTCETNYDNAVPSADSTHSSLHNLLRGVATFSEKVFPQNTALFQRLAQGQSPHTLMITCADSRVVPEMITQTQPGELFVCRNIGNIVPGYGQMMGGVSAVVEYAVLALKVKHIIICGHTDCGAMRALAANASSMPNMQTVKRWLRNAEAVRSVLWGHSDTCDVVPALVEENVRLQLIHLRSHPSVAARLSQGKLLIQGWIYDIAHGQVRVLDDATGKFGSIAEACTKLQLISP